MDEKECIGRAIAYALGVIDTTEGEIPSYLYAGLSMGRKVCGTERTHSFGIRREAIVEEDYVIWGCHH